MTTEKHDPNEGPHDRHLAGHESGESPRTAQGQERRGDLMRRRIFGTAEDAFGHLGYQGASIVEITREAGMGLGTFYLYFPSKLDVFRYVLRTRHAQWIQETCRAAEGADEPGVAAQRALTAHFHWIANRPMFLRMLRDAEFVDPSLAAELYLNQAKKYAEKIADASEKGLIQRADPEVLAWCVIATAEFATLGHLVWKREKKVDNKWHESFTDILAQTLGLGPAADASP